MIKEILFITMFSILGVHLYGQDAEPKAPAQKVYKEIMSELGKRNFAAIDSLATVMYEVAKADGDVEGMGNALSTAAMMSSYSGDYKKADSLMLVSAVHYEDAKMYDDLASCYGEISGVKRKSGDIELAFEYARKGQVLLSKCERGQTRIFNSNILSLLHNVTGQMDSCIYYQLDVIKKLPESDSTGYTQAYNNLSSSFLTIGNDEKRKEYLDLALAYSKNGTASQGEVLYKLSDYELAGDNKNLAMEYAQKSLESYKDSKSRTRTKDGYLAMAKVYLAEGRYEKTGSYLDSIASLIGNQNVKYNIDYLLAALKLSIEANEPLSNGITIEKIKDAVYEKDHLDHKVRFHDLLNRYYKKKGNYQAAEGNLQQHLAFGRTLTGKQNIQTVNNLEELYKTEQRELQIDNLELTNSRQSQRLVGGGIALGLISLLSFFLFRLYRQVRSQKEIITKALSEKDLLLREIHHRVKNNLQLVSSLLTLQGRSIDDATALQAINEGKSRVRSMALIHQDLYNKENLTGIGVKEYIEKLTQELFSTYSVDRDSITLHLDVENMELDVDTLVPLGLIINELVTNSLKYAFPEDDNGKLSLHLSKSNDILQLKISDNGIGYDITKVRDNSFGSTLINALTEQLEGKMEISNKDGTQVQILIPSV